MSISKYISCYDISNSTVTINNHYNNKEIEIMSAFRAINGTLDQNVTADQPVNPVLYPYVIFDENGEYNPVTSTFTPKQDGIYSVIASVNFLPAISPSTYRVLVEILINGVPVASDNDFFGEIQIGNVTSVSAIIVLSAGDVVSVSSMVSTNGIILANPTATHFEAARFPSPIKNCSSNSITLRSNELNNIDLVATV